MKQFIEAFLAAQKEMKSAHKESENPFFHSKYADLSSIDAACREALNSNGIAISQQIDFEGDVNFIRTELLHLSGEKLTSRCRIYNPKSDSQGFGSSVSYMRRYSLASICGVVTKDDDDANSADGKLDKPPEKKTTFTAVAPMKSSLKPGDYVCKVKKFQGKKLSELKDFEILGYIDWLKANVAKPFPDQAEFMNEGQKYLDYLNKKHPSEPPPVYDDLLDLPWPETK